MYRLIKRSERELTPQEYNNYLEQIKSLSNMQEVKFFAKNLLSNNQNDPYIKELWGKLSSIEVKLDPYFVIEYYDYLNLSFVGSHIDFQGSRSFISIFLKEFYKESGEQNFIKILNLIPDE